MTFLTRPAATDHVTLESLLARLAHHASIDGVLLVGSTGGGALSATSDYDLLIVMADTTPLHVGLAWIDGRLADLVFTDAATIDALVKRDEPASFHTRAGGLLRWLESGRIAFDRQGRLARAQAFARAGDRLWPDDDGAIYQQWFKINYNLQHNRRLARSNDPAVQVALEMRMLYCLAELTVAYFRVRRLAWNGDKQAVRYWQEHDPAYLAAFQAALAARDMGEKLAVYERLARLTLAPVGGLWDAGVVALNFSDEVDFSPERLGALLDWWQEVSGGE
ncbi:MAG: hypothetical protein JW910_10510 [Anaerolineae bacterium]|nr:hypothetical protein [Anaerolineae bacterium]